MKRISRIIALSTLSAMLSTGFAFAQDQQNRQDHQDRQDHQARRDSSHYVRHSEWKKGRHIKMNDWNRGDRIDYRTYHLNAPPRGYEWREVDGNYVMAAIATGVIASVIIASSAR